MSDNFFPTSVHQPVKGARSLSSFALRRALATLGRLRGGILTLHSPDGRCYRLGNATGTQAIEAELSLHSFAALRRSFFGGDLGFAESYLRGEWSSPDLSALLLLLLRNRELLKPLTFLSALQKRLARVRHLLNDNSLRGSRRNIASHYDLGNDFYKVWLDPTMTYSAALFSSPHQSLAEAQANKYDLIADWAGVNARTQLLEIGCGWGGFARQCHARFGNRITGLTLSRQQLSYARHQAQAMGMGDKLDFRLQDYRHCRGTYDAIVSIEMFEAVGERHWGNYFTTLRDRLKDGGSAVLQVIAIADDRYAAYRRGADFIQRYIFPGGFLPGLSVLRDLFARHGFRVERERLFGPDYARTLALWRESFIAHWPQLEQQGFDTRFRRMWLYYLSYCEAGFMEGAITVGLFKIGHSSSPRSSSSGASSCFLRSSNT